MINHINEQALQANFNKFKSGLKYKLFLFYKLPLAWLAGLKVEEIDRQKCQISVPYKWLSQNPFKSIYFAAQAMAAELSTGLIAFSGVQSANAKVSMLVVKMEAEYYKKANTKVVFTCADAQQIFNSINAAIDSKEGQTITAISNGINTAGEKVSTFRITWSFKVKSE